MAGLRHSLAATPQGSNAYQLAHCAEIVVDVEILPSIARARVTARNLRKTRAVDREVDVAGPYQPWAFLFDGGICWPVPQFFCWAAG